VKPARFSRRDFLAGAAGCALASCGSPEEEEEAAAEVPPWFRISLAEWSLHRAIRGGELDPLDFPLVAKRDYGIEAVEYVNQLFMDKATDRRWLGELKQRCSDEGVSSVLIMVDREGRLGEPDEARRIEAVENHRKWLDAARHLGCHSIRVNAASEGSFEEQQKLAADGLRRLCEVARPLALNVIVENHGGLSSDGGWLAGTIERVDMDNCGTLPDFGNFRIGPDEQYDPYQGVAELMPHAKGVSAKSYEFDEQGDERRIDYRRTLEIVRDSGYRGYIGIEYEGPDTPEPEGIRLTKELLERLRDELA